MPAASTFSTPIEFEKLNEADVRAEIVDPMLRSLGYQAGTTNNIVRDHSFRYEWHFLGRKGKNDQPLIGKPDYVLEVSTIGRWALEAKGPNICLGVDEFEQAQSYALHPNVAASIFVLTNGREFKLFQANAKSVNEPLLSFTYAEAHRLWPQIHNLLSPAGFVRNVPRVRFDPRRPVAPGYGGSLQFSKGLASPTEAWCSLPLPEASMKMLANIQSHIPHGTCERGPDGRLEMSVEFGSAVGFVDRMMKRKGLDRIPIYSNQADISIDPAIPTLFTGEFVMKGEQGEEFFDFNTWEAAPLPVPITCYARIDALGVLKEGELSGDYALRMYMKVMGLDIDTEQLGTFTLSVAQRA